MLLNEEMMTALAHIASLRGINLGEHRCAQVYRELERKGRMTDPEIFDRFRELGASISFSQERGLIEALNEMERRRQARYAEAHRQLLESERRRAEWEAEADRDWERRRRANAGKPTGYAGGGKRYTGAALRKLLSRPGSNSARMTREDF